MRQGQSFIYNLSLAILLDLIIGSTLKRSGKPGGEGGYSLESFLEARCQTDIQGPHQGFTQASNIDTPLI